MQAGATVAAPAVRPLTVQTAPQQPATSTSGCQQQQQNTASQMSPNTAKKKCKNFLATLIRLASDQPVQTATNVKGLSRTFKSFIFLIESILSECSLIIYLLCTLHVT